MSGQSQVWLMKSEPEVYSIADLERDGKTAWTGVRNYQARNFMRDAMRAGDSVLFYHSNAEPSGIAGLGRVVGNAYADPTQFDRASEYFEPRATLEKPVWFLVDIAFVERFPRLVSLADLKKDVRLNGLLLLKRGSRLSVQPVSRPHFDCVLQLARAGKN